MINIKWYVEHSKDTKREQQGMIDRWIKEHNYTIKETRQHIKMLRRRERELIEEREELKKYISDAPLI